MDVKTDLRVIKTKRNIKLSFIQLLNEKDFNSITIKNILDRALINRSTFYKYYADKYDLAEKVSQEFLEKFTNLVILTFTNEKSITEVLALKDELLTELYTQKLTILGLWKIHTENIHVYDDMHHIITQNYVNLLEQNKDNHDIEYESYICAASMLATLKFILENQKIYTVSELATRLQNFHNTFLKKDKT